MAGPFTPEKGCVLGRESARWRIPFGAGGRQRRQELARVDRMVAAAQLEMELWLGNAAGGTDTCDDLAASDFLAAFDQYHIAMRIGRDPPIRVLDQNEVAVTAQFVAGVGDDSPVGGFDRGTPRGRDIDTVVMRTVPPRAIAG